MHSIRLYAPQEILGRLLFFWKWIPYVTSLFLFKSNKPFSEKVAYVYNCIERSIFSPETFRVFVRFQLQNVLFCEVYVVKGHSPLSQREAMWFHFGALTLTYDADRNKYSRCQSLGKYFERPRTERAFACLTRATIEWKQEWTFLRNRKIINEQKKTSIFTCT